MRHREDYACIVLLDQRYQNPKVNAKISGWLMRSYQAVDQPKESLEPTIRNFFAKRTGSGIILK